MLLLRGERMLAHSLRLVLPRITAPASRSRCTMCASRFAVRPASASEPALVAMRSAVAMLSFSSTGSPCNGLRTWSRLSSRSSARACACASGFSSITARSRGPRRSIAWMRFRK